MDLRFDQAIRRLRLWILLFAAMGTAAAAAFYGISLAGGFMLGAVAAYINLRLIDRAVERVARLATGDAAKPGSGTGAWMFIRFGIIVTGAFVILRFSGFNVAAMCGFLVCPAAVMIEIFYELLTYGHS